MTISKSVTDYRALFTDLEVKVPVFGAEKKPYINFDNAASTPALSAVQESVNAFLPYYSSVHRGTGFKSQLSTHVYEQARRTVLNFVGAHPDEHTCIFGKNTTEAINKLANRFPFSSSKDVVLTSGLEHHSNDLPWRSAAKTVHVGLTPEGQLDEADFDAKLVQYKDRLALVAISGASNVTGYILDIHRLAEKTHAAGAQILVDCAQLAPHRAVDMRSLSDPAHIDYVAISAHKMYAPFGTGALVGRRDVFERGDPDMKGGGTVEIVTLESVVWADTPDRDEAGSPNTIGAVALAAAINALQKIGMHKVAQHEAELTEYALKQLQTVSGVEIFGDRDPSQTSSRLGVIPFRMKGMSHFKVAAILGHEFSIGVRSGCFCAHPYILHLLGLSQAEAQQVREQMLAGDKREMPGLVRASFGLYNTLEEIDVLTEALESISAGKYQGRYVQDTASGEYNLEGWQPDFERFFSLNGRVANF
jgi:cysteine desulfurase/selenocysteine lyase